MRREALARNARRPGRILRLKRGYNPNSSSMGSIVFGLPSLLLGTTVAFGAVAGFICSAFMRRKGRPPAEKAGPRDRGTAKAAPR